MSEKFDPRNPEYKKVEDLPQEHQEAFVDVPEKSGGGFVRKEVQEKYNRARDTAEKNIREVADAHERYKAGDVFALAGISLLSTTPTEVLQGEASIVNDSFDKEKRQKEKTIENESKEKLEGMVIVYRYNPNLASAFSRFKDEASLFKEFPADISTEEMIQWCVDFSKKYYLGEKKCRIVSDRTIGDILGAVDYELGEYVDIVRQGTETGTGSSPDRFVENEQNVQEGKSLEQAAYIVSIAEKAKNSRRKMLIVKDSLSDHVTLPSGDQEVAQRLIELYKDKDEDSYKARKMEREDIFTNAWVKILRNNGVENIEIIDNMNELLKKIETEGDFLKDNLIVVDHHCRDVFNLVGKTSAFVSAYPETLHGKYLSIKDLPTYKHSK